MAKKEYSFLKERHEERKKEYNKTKKLFSLAQRDFRKSRSEFNWKSSLMTVSKKFKIILKDKTELSAQLIALSKNHDLALLKTNGYKTPYVKLSEFQSITQGMNVYAIGSPVGLKDIVTSGVVSSVGGEYVFTDTQILPGNSGGPLLSEAGRVLGVNVAKTAEFVSAEGFGIAIRVDVVKREFKKHFGKLE